MPLMLPVIGDVTVSPPSVPTLVRLDVVTPEAMVLPVSVPAAAGTTIFPVPSKDTPLIVRAFCNAVAVPALPVMLPVIVPMIVGLVIVGLVPKIRLPVPLASEIIERSCAEVVDAKSLNLLFRDATRAVRVPDELRPIFAPSGRSLLIA